MTYQQGSKNMSKLCILEIAGCQALRSLPESVGVLTGLTSLTLSMCGAIESLPDSVGALTALTSLNLSDCRQLQSLPESVGALAVLTSLNLGRCRELPSLPESIWALTRLTSLNLFDCWALQVEDRYRWAAKQGDAGAQCNLGVCYRRGTGVEKDEVRAVEWTRKAAEQGHTEAQANLAEYLMEGLGGPPDWVEALRHFEAVLDVYPPAKVTTAWMLWEGQRGIQQDRPRAERLCEEVLQIEDYEVRLNSDNWVAVGWTWPAALKWFEGGSWK